MVSKISRELRQTWDFRNTKCFHTQTHIKRSINKVTTLELMAYFSHIAYLNCLTQFILVLLPLLLYSCSITINVSSISSQERFKDRKYYKKDHTRIYTDLLFFFKRI